MTATVNMRMPRNFTDMQGRELGYDGGMSEWGKYFLYCGLAFVVGAAMFCGGMYASSLGYKAVGFTAECFGATTCVL